MLAVVGVNTIDAVERDAECWPDKEFRLLPFPTGEGVLTMEVLSLLLLILADVGGGDSKLF